MPTKSADIGVTAGCAWRKGSGRGGGLFEARLLRLVVWRNLRPGPFLRFEQSLHGRIFATSVGTVNNNSK
jgi:hypothetical protein